MKKVILFVVIAVVSAFCIDYIATPYIAYPGASASSSGYNENEDSTRIGVNKLIDTVKNAYTRWSLFSNHDSTFKWMDIDTIAGPVRIDTALIGRVDIDTVNGPVVINDTIINTELTAHLNSLLSKTAFDDSLNANIGSDNYVQKASGSKLVNSLIQDDGTTVACGGLLETGSNYINNDGTDGVGLNFRSGNGMQFTLGSYNVINSIFRGVDETSEYFAIGVEDDAASITAGSSGSDNVDLLFRTCTAGSESEAMRLKYTGVLQTNGNYINNDGTADEGLTFNSGNQGVFTDDLSIGKSIFEDWASSYKSIQLGGNSALMGLSAEGMNSSLYFLNNSYFDGAWKRVSTDEVSQVLMSSGYVAIRCDDVGTADVGFTPTEIMRINHNGTVQTNGSYINNDGTASEGLVFDASNNGTFTENLTVTGTFSNSGITTALGAKLDKTAFDDSLAAHIPYLDTTFYDSLFIGGVYQGRALARVIKTGPSIVMEQPPIGSVLNTGARTKTELRGIPSAYLPSAGDTLILPIQFAESTSRSHAFHGFLVMSPDSVIVKDLGTSSQLQDPYASFLTIGSRYFIGSDVYKTGQTIVWIEP